jgi:hypothetical protein
VGDCLARRQDGGREIIVSKGGLSRLWGMRCAGGGLGYYFR